MLISREWTPRRDHLRLPFIVLATSIGSVTLCRVYRPLYFFQSGLRIREHFLATITPSTFAQNEHDFL